MNELTRPASLIFQAFLARRYPDRTPGMPPYLRGFLSLAAASVFVCWRKKNLATRPYTILAVLVMLQLLVSYHRLYDHAFMLAAIPGLYEIKQRSRSGFLLFVAAFSSITSANFTASRFTDWDHSLPARR